MFEKFKSKSILFDSHAHISAEDYDKDLDLVIKRSKESGVEVIFDVSVNLESSKKSLEISKKYPRTIFSFVGIDPEVFIPHSPLFIGFDKNEKWFEEQYNQLSELVTQNSKLIVGLGETGIDRYHNEFNYKGDRLSHSDLERSNEMQEGLFKLHLELAQKFKLPLSIHSRRAEKKCIEIVKNYDVRGIFHSFTGNYNEAKKILDVGWGLGVNGIITFKKAEELRAVYRKILGKIPLRLADTSPSFDKLRMTGEESYLITPDYFYQKGVYFETDSPYLSPEGKRGERNEPENIRIIFDQFCEMLK